MKTPDPANRSYWLPVHLCATEVDYIDPKTGEYKYDGWLGYTRDFLIPKIIEPMRAAGFRMDLMFRPTPIQASDPTIPADLGYVLDGLHRNTADRNGNPGIVFHPQERQWLDRMGRPSGNEEAFVEAVGMMRAAGLALIWQWIGNPRACVSFGALQWRHLMRANVFPILDYWSGNPVEDKDLELLSEIEHFGGWEMIGLEGLRRKRQREVEDVLEDSLRVFYGSPDAYLGAIAHPSKADHYARLQARQQRPPRGWRTRIMCRTEAEAKQAEALGHMACLNVLEALR